MNEVTTLIFKHQRIFGKYISFFCLLLGYNWCQKFSYNKDNLSKAHSETFPCICSCSTYHLLDNHKLNNSTFLNSSIDFGNVSFHPIFVLCPPCSWIKSLLSDLCAFKSLTSTQARVPIKKSWNLACICCNNMVGNYRLNSMFDNLLGRCDQLLCWSDHLMW